MGIGRIGELATDVETAFGTDQVESYRYQRLAEPIEMDLKTGRLEDTTVQARLHDFAGFKDASEFGSNARASIYAEGLPAALDSTEVYSAPQNSLLEMVTAAMGGVYGASGSDISGVASTTTVVDVTNGEGARFSKGGALVVSHDNGTAVPYEMREIKDMDDSGDPDQITLKMALHTAPTTAATDVYNCVTCYLDEDNVGGDGDSLMFRYIGALTNDQWLCRGVGPTFTLTTDVDGFVRFNFDLQVATWEKSTAGAAFGASYVGAGPLVMKTGQIQWQQVGTTTRNILSPASVEIDPGLQLVPERSVTPSVGGPGAETTLRYRMVRSTPKIKFAAYAYENFDEFWTHSDDEDRKQMFMLVVGSQPVISSSGTGMIGFSLPNAWYTQRPKVTRTGDLMLVECELQGMEDDDVTSPSTDIHYSAFRIHFA